MVTNYPQGGGQFPPMGLPDRTGPPNQTRPTPHTTAQPDGPIWVSDGTTSNQGPKIYTEADFVSFDIKRTEEQKSFTTVDLKFEHGLRTDYGKNKNLDQERRIITNYVKVNQKPKWVYVYELIFVRERKPATQDRPVKNKTEKGAIFEALKGRPGYAGLRDRRDYATDYDVIWSTRPLFPNNADGTEAIPAEEMFFQVLHPFTGQAIQWHSIKINWIKTIDAQANVRSLAGGQNATVDDLTRGINAFMTQHTRENATTNGYESTAANRFFLTQGAHQHELDAGPQNKRALVALRGFTLSARPGSDDWYPNIHAGASPFIIKGKVDDLFVRLRDMGLTPREVFKAFRDREVMINNPPSNSPLPRIITEIGNVQLQAKTSWSAFDTELGVQNRTMRTLPVNVGPTGPNAVRYDAGKMTVRGFHAFRGLLLPDQTTRMLDFACKLPIYNKHHIEGPGFDMFGIRGAVGQSRMAEFGFAVGTDLLRIPARMLTPPQLRYQGSLTNPNEASWNLVGRKFFAPATSLKRVVVMDLDPQFHRSDLSLVPPNMTTELRRLGMVNVHIDPTVRFPRVPYRPVVQVPGEKELLQHFGKVPKDAAAVFVILPEANFDLYSRIKRVADLRLGLHVVCATPRKMNRFGGDFTHNMHYANIGMKFNLKGRGINHAVDDNHLRSIIQTGTTSASAACRTIIIGADVAHATGSARPGCPSIAAVVGSVDDSYLHYPGSMRLQLNRQEFITDLRDMVKERLINWAVKHQNTLPENMLMYRDGVSESQYDDVRNNEIPQLQDAFNDAYEFLNQGRSAKANPPKFRLTFVVVGKRHNTRFFTDDKTQDNSFLSGLKRDETHDSVYPGLQIKEKQEFKEKKGKPGQWTRVNHNLKPGFVVDKVITHPYREDFFLQSHMPLQGTGRSAHYFVMTNQMQLTSDVLQRITHATCYIYARATKGVSYCAPAYYADRLCGRGRAWLREHLMGQLSVPQHKDEDFLKFKQRALKEIDEIDEKKSSYRRPQPQPPTTLKYGQKRKNPWHPNLDDIMFYL
jgi:eukaryotic translation initiation factor 2C